MTMILDGSLGVTFPVVAATGSAVQASSGRVLQVVPASFVGTSQSTTSTSFVSTTFTASITPSSASSKVLILYMGENLNTNNAYYSAVTVYKNSTNLGGTDGMLQNNGSSLWMAMTINFLDSPATTSATTYTIYHRAFNAGTTSIMGWGTTANNQMILMEIAA